MNKEQLLERLKQEVEMVDNFDILAFFGTKAPHNDCEFTYFICTEDIAMTTSPSLRLEKLLKLNIQNESKIVFSLANFKDEYERVFEVKPETAKSQYNKLMRKLYDDGLVVKIINEQSPFGEYKGRAAVYLINPNEHLKLFPEVSDSEYIKAFKNALINQGLTKEEAQALLDQCLDMTEKGQFKEIQPIEPIKQLKPVKVKGNDKKTKNPPTKDDSKVSEGTVEQPKDSDVDTTETTSMAELVSSEQQRAKGESNIWKRGSKAAKRFEEANQEDNTDSPRIDVKRRTNRESESENIQSTDGTNTPKTKGVYNADDAKVKEEIRALFKQEGIKGTTYIAELQGEQKVAAVSADLDENKTFIDEFMTNPHKLLHFFKNLGIEIKENKPEKTEEGRTIYTTKSGRTRTE